jgi:hypothetical protein
MTHSKDLLLWSKNEGSCYPSLASDSCTGAMVVVFGDRTHPDWTGGDLHRLGSAHALTNPPKRFLQFTDQPLFKR